MTDQILLEIGGQQLRVGSRRCSLDGKNVTLTPTEFSILEILCREQGKPVSAKELFTRIWGEDAGFGGDSSICVHVCHLRNKLGSRAYIRTVRGAGYQIGTANGR